MTSLSVNSTNETHININSDHVRRQFIGGSDAKTIMGSDEAALRHLREFKRGVRSSEDYSNNLVVALGRATETLNVDWLPSRQGGSYPISNRGFFTGIMHFLQPRWTD